MRKVALRRIGFADIPGGGQVTLSDGLCYVGHMEPPLGTSILDVTDPANPRVIARIDVPLNTHSHKVRAGNGLMLVNNEANPTGAPGHARGLRIFDVGRPDAPREIAFYPTHGRGAHRFDFDGRHVYLSTELEGYQGNVVMILDLADPQRPREVSRWWLPGQWTAGGETPTLPHRHRVHHPLRFGDHLYVGCCLAGLAVVDVTDLGAPKTVARHPLHGHFTHTVLPIGSGRDANRFVAAVDEAWWDEAGHLTIVDLADRAQPTIPSQYDIPPRPEKGVWGAHQPHEAVVDGLLFVAWFAHGLRVLDVSDPLAPTEIGAFLPEARSESGVMSNDVFVDPARGRVYLIDRERGLDILEMEA
jgi:hypothetical protein